MTELARPFAMALPSFAQHMRVLEEQGIVRSAKVGRVRTYELDGVRLEPASDWLATVHDEWESRHDRLVDYVQRLGRDAG
jgi:DNA-binding transcriptional ArsR family regulator